MAEGLLRHLAGERVSVRSAGVAPSSVNPLAVRAMDQIGVDIRGQRSQHVNEFLAEPFDTVITVCDRAAETCPSFPGQVKRIHWSLPDPASGRATRRSVWRPSPARATICSVACGPGWPKWATGAVEKPPGFALLGECCILRFVNVVLLRLHEAFGLVRFVIRERRPVMQNGTLDITLTYCAS